MGWFDALEKAESSEPQPEKKPEVQIIDDDEEMEKKNVGKKAQREGIISALIRVAVISVIIIAVSYFFLRKKPAVGPLLIALGLLPLLAIKLSKRDVSSAGADIVFGAVSSAIIGAFALAGMSFTEIFSFIGTESKALGTVIGVTIGHAISVGIAGIFEGAIDRHLSKKRDTLRTPLSASMGKMAGCLIGIGIVLTIAWTVIGQ